jgi:aspartate/methionine/tyrosine aminotransferase
MFTPLQVAAIAALEGDQTCVGEIAAKYQARRDVLHKGLTEARWEVELPRASMYIWARVPRAGFAGIRQAPAREGEGLRLPRHRLRRPR